MLINIIYLYGMQAINYVIPLIILPYLIRVLGPEEYGKLGFVLSVIQYMVLISDYGFNLYSASRIARNQNDKQKINDIYSQTIYSKFLIFLITLIVLIGIIFTNDKFHDVSFLLCIAMLQVIGTITTPIWLFQGLEKMKTFAMLNIFSKIACLPLIFIFVQDKSDIAYAVLFQTTVYFLNGVASLHLAKRSGVIFVSVPFRLILQNIKNSSAIFLGTFSISLYTASTPIIIGLLSNNYELGIYSAADKIRAALLGLFVILGNVFYPRIQRLMAEDVNAAYQLIRQILKYQLVVCIFASVAFYFISPLVVKYYLGNQFKDSVILLRIMAPMILLIPTSIILSNYILLPFGYQRLFGSIPVITACLHLSYTILLIANYGSVGASISILITEIISFILLLAINIRLGNIHKVFGKAI